MEQERYSSQDAKEMTGASLRQIEYWKKIGVIPKEKRKNFNEKKVLTFHAICKIRLLLLAKTLTGKSSVAYQKGEIPVLNLFDKVRPDLATEGIFLFNSKRAFFIHGEDTTFEYCSEHDSFNTFDPQKLKGTRYHDDLLPNY